MEYDAVWTDEWPKEPGLYWFFGHTCCHAQEKGTSQPELVQVVARLSKGMGLHFIANAAFFRPKEVGDGQWTEGMVPKLPVNFLEKKMSEIVLGPLELITTAPEDYDYGWANTLQLNVAKDKRGKVFRKVKVDDAWHFRQQAMRYGSGMHLVLVEQGEVDKQISYGSLYPTPELIVDIYYLTFNTEPIRLWSRENFVEFQNSLDDLKEITGIHDDITSDLVVTYKVQGEDNRNKVIDLFEKYYLDPIQ